MLKDRESMTHKEKETEAKRAELEFDLIRTQGELALVDYFTAANVYRARGRREEEGCAQYGVQIFGCVLPAASGR